MAAGAGFLGAAGGSQGRGDVQRAAQRLREGPALRMDRFPSEAAGHPQGVWGSREKRDNHQRNFGDPEVGGNRVGPKQITSKYSADLEDPVEHVGVGLDVYLRAKVHLLF